MRASCTAPKGQIQPQNALPTSTAAINTARPRVRFDGWVFAISEPVVSQVMRVSTAPKGHRASTDGRPLPSTWWRHAATRMISPKAAWVRWRADLTRRIERVRRCALVRVGFAFVADASMGASLAVLSQALSLCRVKPS